MKSPGILGRITSWFQRRPQKKPEVALLRLNEVVVVLATKEGTAEHPLRMTLTAFNHEQLQCKCHELLPERALLRLALTLPGGLPVTIRAYVEWVEISSFGHSFGLRVLQDRQTREALQESVGYVERGLRHSAVRAN